MKSPSILTAFVVASSFAIASPPTLAQEAPKPGVKVDDTRVLVEAIGPPMGFPLPQWLDLEDEIKPRPPVAIPDDPPPHEGALFDLPVTIQPPDILVVELLEALPGRPITGERLVRPDGTISMGFYGDVHVRGLTLPQAKTKIILHLRRYLDDEVLGLVKELSNEGEAEMPGQPPIVPPPDLPPGVRNPRNPFGTDLYDSKRPGTKPETPPADEVKPEAGKNPEATKPGQLSSRRPLPLARQGRVSTIRYSFTAGPPRARREEPQEPARPEAPPVKPQEPAKPPVAKPEVAPPGVIEVVAPADSLRVFVDIASHNSLFYYVQGDVGVPGRLPFTGGETVLDAVNYAGGFIPSAEPFDIHLYRPARGGKPAKDYKIDFDAIRKGVATANLQMFPGDRLVVGRNPIVAKTVEVDRAASLINSLMNSMMQYSFTARSVGVMNAPPAPAPGTMTQVRINGQNVPVADPTVMTPAQRDAFIKEWVDLLWAVSSKDGGAMLDEKAFKDALMKKLTPAPDPK